MRLLITGVAGFIGAALAARLLARGDELAGLDKLTPYYSPALKHARLEQLSAIGGSQFKFACADFSNAVELNSALGDQHFDTIVHLGAQPGVRYSLENPEAYIRTNVLGHLNILELARQRGDIRHLVYASSSSVYGGNTKVPFAVGDRVDHPVSLYAATKRSDELMSETYAHLFGIPQTGLRFFTVYGPWGRPDMMPWIFTSKILAGEPVPVFNNGRMYRDFTYIDDIVDGVIAAIDHPPAADGATKPGGSTKPHVLYNIGNNRSEHLLRFIEVLEQACGRKASIEMLPMQPGDVQRTYAEISDIQRDLGYVPSTPIDVGIPSFVRWYRQYHGL